MELNPPTYTGHMQDRKVGRIYPWADWQSANRKLTNVTRFGLEIPRDGGGLPPTAKSPPNDRPGENEGRQVPYNQPLAQVGNQRQDTMRHQDRIAQNTRANILLATLNMRGRLSATLGGRQISKWTEIHSVMKEKQIGILAVQETQLTEENVDQIHQLFGRQLKVLNSSDPDRPTSSAGVAFVVNREIANTADIDFKVLIPGRVTTLTTKWHGTNMITLINVYAPNNYGEHPAFWGEIGSQMRGQHVPSPDFMMGDLNIVEDAIDRSPVRLDNEAACEALQNLRGDLDIVDVWRQDYPDTRQFTFQSTVGEVTQSRLDRVYTRPGLADLLYDWDCTHTSVPTDHSMVLVRYSPANAPEIGPGRWTWPLGLVNDQELLGTVIELGKNLKIHSPLD
ncbi:hypothetical protein JAAARDRAFT_51388 [Jaapia argillacea MUCL 33604]|uniref:Endonuclease/exonuclease/phosphatase domain-containing protein n=1 Tax=Jaapia argillacea MUCL 33604 TaxID=933084 RepID=A0A067PI58_9AGAM|nr:hypothetical protein JAAARDRAFT_51388 [Jaapia argillacea MUCL 33604]